MIKFFNKAVSHILILSVLLTIFTVNIFAVENGTYTMDTITYYVNPDTGATDDGGTGNIELGEGMCRSAVYEKAVVEQTDEGAVITVRMLLYSNLSDIKLSVQEKTKGEYSNIKYSVIKESASNDSADIKFKAPSADSLIRVKMYVVPMSREVCFYMKCDADTAVKSTDDVVVQEQKEEKLSENTKTSFTDINNHWAEKEIEEVVNKGLFSGITETTFEPDKEMTRGMFVTVLGRMSGEKISNMTTNFKDVDNGKYYAPYIAWANKNGIISGISETEFTPDVSVTCEQAAVILSKYADYKNIVFENRSISPSITGVSEWAKENVIRAGKAGIITKQNTNGYNYNSSATRADVASMLSNFTEYYGN